LSAPGQKRRMENAANGCRPSLWGDEDILEFDSGDK